MKNIIISLFTAITLAIPAISADTGWAASANINPKYSVANSKDLERLQRHADNGNNEAQYTLGIIYLTGTGVRVAKDHALALLREASWNGNIKAKNLVAAGYAIPALFDVAPRKQNMAACPYLLSHNAKAGDKLAEKMLAYAYLFDVPGVPRVPNRSTREVASEMFQKIGIPIETYRELAKNSSFNAVYEKELQNAYGLTMKYGNVTAFDDSNYPQ